MAETRTRPASAVWAWIAAASLTLAAATVYGPVLLGLVGQWADDSDASYGSLVALAALLAIRQRWARLRTLPAQPSRLGGAALALAATLYLVGALAADVFLLRVSLVASGAAAVLFVCGRAHLAALAAPLVLCLVAIPLPSVVITELTMPLQLMASRCAVALLDLGGVPVLREGNVLTLSHVTLEVAEACSGMRSLVTLTAVIAIFASLRGVTPLGAALLAAAALPVALAGNGARIAFTGVLASHIGEKAARGAIHDLTGWLAFVLMCGALLGVHAAASSCAALRRTA